MPTRDEVADVVRAIVADTLAVELEEATPAARFFADLGGESIEVLETQFQIEKRLGVKVDFSQLLASSEIRAESGGVLSRESLETMKERYPFLAIEKLGERVTPEDLTDLLTVGAIVEFVWMGVDARRAGEGEPGVCG